MSPTPSEVLKTAVKLRVGVLEMLALLKIAEHGQITAKDLCNSLAPCNRTSLSSRLTVLQKKKLIASKLNVWRSWPMYTITPRAKEILKPLMKASSANSIESQRQVVLRVQDQNGLGPYRPGFTESWVDGPESSARQPDFIREFGWDAVHNVPKHMHFGFGFRNLDQLNNWFSETELKRLMTKYDYEVVALEADFIFRESRHQVMFGRSLPFTTGILVDAVQ
jgi:hypothetical protein